MNSDSTFDDKLVPIHLGMNNAFINITEDIVLINFLKLKYMFG
jgi:hypothetical protein